MDLREKILRTSMDYETFPNKHNLISDVIKYNQQQSNAKFTEIFEQASNSFEALMGVYTVAREFIRKTSPVFIADIKRLYPEAFEQYKAQEIDHILSLAKIIKRAKDEGLALPGVKCKIAAFIFTNNMKSIHNMQDFPFPEYTAAEVFDGAFLNFMRGIATTRGQEIIENYVVNTLSNKEN